jgi:hypothetical protein
MEPSTASDFLKFIDGDVIVIITPGTVYQLHSTVLRRSSPIFADLLREDLAATLSNKQKKAGNIIRYRLILTSSLVTGGIVFEMTVSGPSKHVSWCLIYSRRS